MRDILRLLFGHIEDKRPDQLSDEDSRPSWDEGFGLADRVRRSGEWCGTTPRRGSAESAVRSPGKGSGRFPR